MQGKEVYLHLSIYVDVTNEEGTEEEIVERIKTRVLDYVHELPNNAGGEIYDAEYRVLD